VPASVTLPRESRSIRGPSSADEHLEAPAAGRRQSRHKTRVPGLTARGQLVSAPPGRIRQLVSGSDSATRLWVGFGNSSLGRIRPRLDGAAWTALGAFCTARVRARRDNSARRPLHVRSVAGALAASPRHASPWSRGATPGCGRVAWRPRQPPFEPADASTPRFRSVQPGRRRPRAVSWTGGRSRGALPLGRVYRVLAAGTRRSAGDVFVSARGDLWRSLSELLIRFDVGWSVSDARRPRCEAEPRRSPACRAKRRAATDLFAPRVVPRGTLPVNSTTPACLCSTDPGNSLLPVAGARAIDHVETCRRRRNGGARSSPTRPSGTVAQTAPRSAPGSSFSAVRRAGAAVCGGRGVSGATERVFHVEQERAVAARWGPGRGGELTR